MSKKTKREKILADLRKKLKNANPSPEFNPPSSTFNFQLRESNEPQKKEINNKNNAPQSESLYIYPVHLIKKDLTKTLLLCILAISLELALFFILKNR